MTLGMLRAYFVGWLLPGVGVELHSNHGSIPSVICEAPPEDSK
jgi:hypothetical protein